MDALYEQMNFVLSGGALKLLTDFLKSRVRSALIVEPQGNDLAILDAVNAKTERLILKDQAHIPHEAFSRHPFSDHPFSHHSLSEPFETSHAVIKDARRKDFSDGEWTDVVRIRGKDWTLYILLSAAPPESLLSQLHSCAGLIYLWQSFRHIGATEERLSRLSYMILTTKSTLASIFEPMPFTWYVALLADIMRESLFPQSVALFSDDGSTLSFLEGDERLTPRREGIYAQNALPPVPVLMRQDDGRYYEAVIPLSDRESRLFCVLRWEDAPTQEMLNFLELLGCLATRALSAIRLRAESTAGEERLSSDEFAILSLSRALAALKGQEDRSQFLAVASDVFLETTGASGCFMAIWDKNAAGYVPVLYRKDGLAAPFSESVLPLSAPVQSERATPFFDLWETTIPSALKTLGLPNAEGRRELDGMRWLFPLWDTSGRLEGFTAISMGAFPLEDKTRLATLQIVAQFVALGLKRFVD